MRFIVSLTLWILLGYGVCNGVYAAEKIDLSFSVYLEINDKFIYPFGQSVEDPKSKPFEMILNVKRVSDKSLRQILLDFCRDKLEISVIDTIQVSLISFLIEGAMVTHVESFTSSCGASPVTSDNGRSFPMADLLDLNKKDLIEQIQGQSLRVSIQSSTDSIYTVGFRLRQRELS